MRTFDNSCVANRKYSAKSQAYHYARIVGGDEILTPLGQTKGYKIHPKGYVTPCVHRTYIVHQNHRHLCVRSTLTRRIQTPQPTEQTTLKYRTVLVRLTRSRHNALFFSRVSPRSEDIPQRLQSLTAVLSLLCLSRSTRAPSVPPSLKSSETRSPRPKRPASRSGEREPGGVVCGMRYTAATLSRLFSRVSPRARYYQRQRQRQRQQKKRPPISRSPP